MIPILLASIIGMNLLALAMILLRPKLYNTKLYKPMVKNIVLSVLPGVILLGTSVLCIQLTYSGYQEGIRNLVYLAIIAAAMGMLIWLLLLPNSGYLITELNFNHRQADPVEVPIWYDIISILSLAISGVLNTCLNILIVQSLYISLFNQTNNISLNNPVSWAIMFVVLFLVSAGIYLGRYIRFNSWDILHPIQFMKRLYSHFRKKGAKLNAFLFIVFHSLFFSLFYCSTMANALQPFILFILS